MRPLSTISLAFALLSSASYADTSPALTEFTPCRIGIAPTTLPAECASITVPFTYGLTEGLQSQKVSGKLSGNVNEPTDPDTKKAPDVITLSIAKIAARSHQAAADPLTLLAGGPGQSATDSWPQLHAAFYPTLANRDIYLIDQRGTGNSVRMNCPQTHASQELTLDLDKVRNTSLECYNDQEHPTQWFTTSVAVRDLNTVREALGIANWNLYGVSYGTRVALHYLRRYPEHTRSVILDAVVAPQKPIGPELSLHSQQALDALFARCANDTGCAEAFPDLAAKTKALFASLKESPRTIQYENISLGALDSIEFNDQHLASTVRLLSYSSYGTAILPSMLYDAATNDNLAPFARQTAIQLGQLGGSLATGMHAAVICTEDAPYINTINDRDQLAQTYLGDSVIDSMQASCEPWPRGIIDKDFHEPVVSDTPVLALSGAVDPITPPSYAELAIESLSNARHIVNPDQGHTQAPLGCMPIIMSQFIDTITPAELDLDCLERLAPPALFIDANGPLP